MHLPRAWVLVHVCVFVGGVHTHQHTASMLVCGLHHPLLSVVVCNSK